MNLYIRWENRYKQRYYCVYLAKDMFTQIVLTKAWGGINSASGRITHVHCMTIEEATHLIEKITQTRIRNGYILISEQRDNIKSELN